MVICSPWHYSVYDEKVHNIKFDDIDLSFDRTRF